MRKKVLCFALTCILMSIGVPASAQHEFVDLGLSVKWATCNVGADRPEDAGDLYSWGEDGKQGNYTKYCDKDNKTVLDQEDDVAHVKWGGSWRMPTGAELDELREECIWTWTKVNGVNGYRVSGKKEGFENNSIFLPVNVHNSSNAIEHGMPAEFGLYWSSSLSYNANSFFMGRWDHANGYSFFQDTPTGNASFRNEGLMVYYENAPLTQDAFSL